MLRFPIISVALMAWHQRDMREGWTLKGRNIWVLFPVTSCLLTYGVNAPRFEDQEVVLLLAQFVTQSECDAASRQRGATRPC